MTSQIGWKKYTMYGAIWLPSVCASLFFYEKRRKSAKNGLLFPHPVTETGLTRQFRNPITDGSYMQKRPLVTTRWLKLAWTRQKMSLQNNDKTSFQSERKETDWSPVIERRGTWGENCELVLKMMSELQRSKNREITFEETSHFLWNQKCIFHTFYSIWTKFLPTNTCRFEINSE